MIYVLIFLFLELLFTINFGSNFGVLITFIEFIVSFVIGNLIFKSLQVNMQENMKRVVKREISSEEFLSLGLFKLLGSLLLMIPGIFTDTLGILMQFEFFATLFANKVLPKHLNKSQRKESDDANIIDVEIIDSK